MSDGSRPVTIRDLSAACGLSIATISLALRNHPRISASTRKKIAEVAEKLGYRPNPMMAAHWATVRARKSPAFQAVVAVLNDWETVPTMQNYPWLDSTYDAMARRASELGYLIEEFSVAGPDHKTRCKNLAATLKVLKARGIYAIAPFFSAHPSIFSESLQLLDDFASVFICAEYMHLEHEMSNLRHLPFHRTNPDHYGNMLALLEALKSAGYRRPGFWPNSWAEARVAGESTAAFNFWIQSLPSVDQIPVKWTKWQVDPPLETARQQFLKWLPAKKPDVVICQMFEVQEWIRSLDLRIPRDIGLAHTALGPPEDGWSGIDCRLPGIASAGIDLLTAHLHRNERGAPGFPKDVKIEGFWVQGTTTVTKRPGITST